jgi:hypothetical protein
MTTATDAGGHRTYVFRLYPTKTQAILLHGHMSEAARLYNAALQERRDAFRVARKTITYVEQSRHHASAINILALGQRAQALSAASAVLA